MATDAQTLLAEAKCYECYGSNEYSLHLMKLAMLKQILEAANPMADTSPQALLAEAKCYACYGSSGMWPLMELALLRQILEVGIGGGGMAGAGPPTITYPAGPTNDQEGTPYVDTLTGMIYWWYNGIWNP